MRGEVLVLNSDYEPLNICGVRRALCLLYKGKVDVLETNGHWVTTGARTFRAPSVVRLRDQVRRPVPQLRLSRRSVLARDDYTCQYCGIAGRDMTIDHVVPKRLGGPSTWENLVACCRKCNAKKSDKPLPHSGMALKRAPKRPKFIPYISFAKYVAGTKNTTWTLYLPPVEGITHTSTNTS